MIVRSSIALFAGALLVACAGTRPPAYAAAGVDAAPEMREATSGDIKLRVRVLGNLAAGPPLLIVPGGPGLSLEYLYPLDALATEERALVTYDPRGVGGSQMPRSSVWSISDHVADLEAVRAALGVEKLHIGAHSWAGLIAIAYAAVYSSRVTSLVLIDSVAPTAKGLDTALKHLEARKDELAPSGIVPGTLPAAKEGDCLPVVLAIAPLWFADPKHPRAKDFGEATCHDVTGPNSRGISDYDLRRLLENVIAPALVLQGEAGPYGPVADEIVASLKHARVNRVLLPACGHIPWMECPEPFFTAVSRFLDGAAAGLPLISP